MSPTSASTISQNPIPAPAAANDAEHIRSEQVARFDDEDFGRYFALSDQLAAVSVGYARSYEFWLQTVLQTLARLQPSLTFLQVGGMDGKRYDPVYPFIKHYRWRGFILEPLRDLYEALSQNYAGFDNVTLVNAALADSDGPRTMLRVRRQAALDGAVPLWAEGLGTLHPERNALGGVGVDADLHAALLSHAHPETVACLTLASLIERHAVPSFDLLQVDAEGCELDILRQVDQAGHKPMMVHLEFWALPPAERRELLGLLVDWGYFIRMSESDVMGISPALKTAVDAAVGWSC